MAGAAPFIAHPVRRLVAGFLDLVLAVMSAGIASTIAQAVGYNANEAELALLGYALYHAAFYWAWDGQTIGLRILDIRSVSAIGGAGLSALQIIARATFRPALLYVLGWAAYWIARDQPSVFAVILLTPLLGELGMMFTLPSRQTLSDMVSRTLVVNVPPPQPHRAPAAPMYSATDAEFGVRPRRVR